VTAALSRRLWRNVSFSGQMCPRIIPRETAMISTATGPGLKSSFLTNEANEIWSCGVCFHQNRSSWSYCGIASFIPSC